MKTELTRITISLPIEQREALAEWTDRKRQPFSYLVRQLLEDYFKEQREES
jgi:predicted DNA-binding protein